MSLPEIVQSTLGEEPAAARVSLGGEDELLVTPTRTLIYRADGLLSDESVEEYPHDAERVEVSAGRRKSKVSLDYGLDGERTFTLPSKVVDDALHPVLAGVLNAAGITDPGETVKQTYRFSDLTIIVTSARLVKHIGSAVWDEDFEEFHFADVVDLQFEEGSVATSVVLTLADRGERFKAPNEQARSLRETLTEALLAFYDVQSLEEFRVTVDPDEDEADDTDDRDTVSFGEGPDPLSANPSKDAARAEAAAREASEATEKTQVNAVSDSGGANAIESEGFGASGFEAAGVEDTDVAAELAALRQAIEAQNEQLSRQEQLIDQLITELRQGR